MYACHTDNPHIYTSYMLTCPPSSHCYWSIYISKIYLMCTSWSIYQYLLILHCLLVYSISPNIMYYYINTVLHTLNKHTSSLLQTSLYTGMYCLRISKWNAWVSILRCLFHFSPWPVTNPSPTKMLYLLLIMLQNAYYTICNICSLQNDYYQFNVYLCTDCIVFYMGYRTWYCNDRLKFHYQILATITCMHG